MTGGFEISESSEAFCEFAFLDIGGVAFHLKAVSWQVRGFDVGVTTAHCEGLMLRSAQADASWWATIGTSSKLLDPERLHPYGVTAVRNRRAVQSLGMELVQVEGAMLACRTVGSGPALLAPECNYTWAPEFEDLMARRFTVVVASPRDFGASTRTGGPYHPDRWATDMVAVAQHFGHQSFSIFGYSFTGAFGPWLALKLKHHGAVVAVASGGFPLLGDYRVTARDVDEQTETLRQDPARWTEYGRRFDLLAAAAFYHDLATLAPDSLVDAIPCPLYTFWGDQDVDAVEIVMPHAQLADGLTERGVPWKQYAGFDHEQLNANLSVAWPATEAWLLHQTASGPR